jgi:hypothetical protein
MTNNDNQFDEILRNAAQDYNRPPAVVPRDAMWEAIEAAQVEKASRPLHIVSTTSHRPLPRFVWLGAAAAAVLLVATGVGIGRWSTLRVPAPASSVKTRTIASNNGNTGSPKTVVTQPEVGATGSASQNPASKPGTSVGSSRDPGSSTPLASRSRGTIRSASPERSRVATANQNRGGANSSSRGTVGYGAPPFGTPSGVYPGATRQEVPYQVATIRHLADAEALLTAFRTDSRDAKMDAQLSRWARDLLSNTRLLLDSPAGDDPQRARLLGDLELVLAQMVQLSPSATAQDRELIEGSIRNGQVMTRLRSAIPAGPTRGL